MKIEVGQVVIKVVGNDVETWESETPCIWYIDVNGAIDHETTIAEVFADIVNYFSERAAGFAADR